MQENVAPKKKSVAEKEVETLAFWQENKIFEKSIAHPAGLEAPAGDFSFYDGPPFATGLPHHGHILAGTLKDAIPRFQTMRGNSVRRVWGWDCHGLPIENLIEKEFGLNHKQDIEKFGIEKFNRAAREAVLRYEKEWKERIPRLGRFVDMEHAYKTMDPEFTESIWWSFKELHSKSLIYEGYKIMHICPRCETTLAQSEVAQGYKDVTDISVTVKMELVDEPGTCVLAWTTTPWTLPGNVALALKADAMYVRVTVEGEEGIFIVAKERAETVFKDKKYTLGSEFLGTELVGKSYTPVFSYFTEAKLDNKENIWKIWNADFVTMDTGTGVVHIAPAFGADDMVLAKTNNLPVIKHVKMDGTFTEEVNDMQGVYVKKIGDTQSTDILIIKSLAHTGKLFSKEKLVHSYPHCWRCDTPLLNYATSSWFVDVPKIKTRLIEENKKVHWVPEHIQEGRFGKWLEGAREWAISRSRYWGAPLPVWKCDACEEVKIVSSINELAEGKKGNNTYIVIRHGGAHSNEEGYLDSHGEPTNHLTEKGKLESEKAAASLLDKKIDIIVTSPLLRAKETTEILAQKLGVSTIIHDPRLAEINLGEYSTGLPGSFDLFVQKEQGLIKNLTQKIPGGESHKDVFDRVTAMWQDFETRYKGKNILLVTHAAPAWMLIASTENLTKEEIGGRTDEGGKKIYLNNAEVFELNPKILPRNEKGEIDLHRPYIDQVTMSCASCPGTMKRILEVFDCWYESGSMPYAEIHYPFENKDLFKRSFPAQFIAEGLDQTRGWFYSLLNLSVGLFDTSPYQSVVVNGIIMAGDGQKMSKSKNNFTDPMELVAKYGADALRYTLLASPLVYGENVPLADSDVDEVYKKIILRLENVFSFYELYKNDADTAVDVTSSKNVLDQWILARLDEVVKKATEGYETYHLDVAVRPIETFVDDLSVWYLRRSRDRLKGDTGEEDRILALATLKYVLLEFAKVMAPVMPFMAERIYQGVGGTSESVHLEKWPETMNLDMSVLDTMRTTREIVSLALQARTKAAIKVRQPLASLTVKTLDGLTDDYLALIRDEVNVKEVAVDANVEGVALDTVVSESLKQEGDFREIVRKIQDARKALGLTPKDIPTLTLFVGTNKNFFTTFEKDLKESCLLAAITYQENADTLTAVTDPFDFAFALVR